MMHILLKCIVVWMAVFPYFLVFLYLMFEVRKTFVSYLTVSHSDSGRGSQFNLQSAATCLLPQNCMLK